MSGKGSKYRPYDKKKFEENFERIFGDRRERKAKPEKQPTKS